MPQTKKLFLSSFASVSLELIKEMLPKSANQLKVAFIPTAGDPYDDKSFVYADREALVKMGMQVADIDLKIIKGKSLEKELNKIDIVFVAGGNTFYLLDHVRKSGFDVIIKKLINKGVIYIGSSAGSALCCPTIEYVKVFDDPLEAPDLTDYTGLNLVDFLIIPHVQKVKYLERIENITDEMQRKGIKVLKLTDDQAILINGSDTKILSI